MQGTLVGIYRYMGSVEGVCSHMGALAHTYLSLQGCTVRHGDVGNELLNDLLH